tara:strand:+ start:2183 stop:2719 length:537 start_codon:yes stop_codon:yes gene_type:complete
MAIDVIVGFNPSTPTPLDSRVTAINANDRLSRKSFNCYEGLLVFQQDTNELYVCIDPTDPSSTTSWELITSENTQESLSRVGNQSITGSLTISGSLSEPSAGNLIVSDTIFTDVISASIAQFTGDGTNSILIITSGSSSPITINSEGLIVFDEYQYTPTPVAGGLLYSGSNFYLGLEC